jgi:tetrahydromethanopterin S-methyltransferase subunit G
MTDIADLTLERLARMQRTMVEIAESTAIQFRLLHRRLDHMDGRLDTIDIRLTAVERAMREVGRDVMVLSNRVEKANRGTRQWLT